MRTLSLLALFLLAACAPGRFARTAPYYAREVITADELTASTATDLYEAMRLLRPTWLRSRGPLSLHGSVSALPIVYVDGHRMGDVSWLVSIPALSVAEARFLSSSDATTRWGTGHASGAILVVTKH